ncbi:MAG: Uma2 family endonuclease, partial [Verrucomicrobia bacterium]|nr:Uma2 family endonuclease [Verrucomicrobiota bacterium]
DYYALPDERRAELIDGVIYDMTAPATLHQLIAGEVYYQLRGYHKKHKLECVPLISPVDVQLDCDNRTMVQPDVLILCDLKKLKRRVVYGAPEFLMEVLSPSTRSKDQLLKLNKYYNAGCLEYWIVDSENERVIVYDFTKDKWPEVYTFNDKVPVGISEGKCEIDFSEIGKITSVTPGFYDDSGWEE